MGRLIRQNTKKIKRLITSKLIKISEWEPIDTTDPELVQYITEVMAAGEQMQIEYEGSGWRLIEPYGWFTSKDGNVLISCYKSDTGEVRTYRLDRVQQVMIDDSLLGMDDNNSIYEVSDYQVDPAEYEIPELPNANELLEISENEEGGDLPFNEALDYLSEDANNYFEQNSTNESPDYTLDDIDNEGNSNYQQTDIDDTGLNLNEEVREDEWL